MKVSKITLYIKYNKSAPRQIKKHNRDLLNFVLNNCTDLNKRGYFVEIQLIDKNDRQKLENLQSKGVTQMPVLIVNNQQPIPTLGKIQNYLTGLKRKKSSSYLSAEEQIHQYYDSQGLLNPKDDQDENESISQTAQQRAIAETRRRNALYNRNHKGPSNPNKQSESEDNIPVQPTTHEYTPDVNTGVVETPANISPDPRMISQTIRGGGADGAIDNDLMAKFWENQTETKL